MTIFSPSVACKSLDLCTHTHTRTQSLNQQKAVLKLKPAKPSSPPQKCPYLWLKCLRSTRSCLSIFPQSILLHFNLNYTLTTDLETVTNSVLHVRQPSQLVTAKLISDGIWLGFLTRSDFHYIIIAHGVTPYLHVFIKRIKYIKILN